MRDEIKIFCAEEWPCGDPEKEGYELLDSGDGEKLERFGPYIFVRPYEEAVWRKTLPAKMWASPHGRFLASKGGTKSGWKMSKGILDSWAMSYRGVKFSVSPTPFRHMGFFPEQASHWDFVEEEVKKAERKRKNSVGERFHLKDGVKPRDFSVSVPLQSDRIKFLNLFGYTGVASFFALRAGAEVTHVDASRFSLNWAKENQKFAGLEQMPMRVILDDAIKFLDREAKRGKKYDCVMMDPPKFGRGPKGETWKIENDLANLLSKIRQILSPSPIFVILTSYATDSSSLALGYSLEEAMKDFKGEVARGELCLRERARGRLVSLANTAIWRR